jgi:hypothetical protein
MYTRKDGEEDFSPKEKDIMKDFTKGSKLDPMEMIKVFILAASFSMLSSRMFRQQLYVSRISLCQLS